MQIKSLDVLKKVSGTSSLYDLTRSTYIDPTSALSVPVYQHIVEEHESGRIDIISYYLYQSTDQVDFLLNFNSIINPLNILEGSVINYVDYQSLGLFNYDDISVDTADSLKKLANTNKKQRLDVNREAVVNNPSLPPTLTDNLTDPVQIKGNQIIIGENLFK